MVCIGVRGIPKRTVVVGWGGGRQNLPGVVG